VSPIFGADRVTYAAYSIGDGLGPNGDGVLATLTLQARSVGNSPLDLSNVTLTDPEAGPISASAEDGQVIVSPPGVSPVVSSITPNWGCTSRVLRNVVVVGQNFQTGASVQLVRSGQNPISAEMPVVQSATRISCTLSIGKAALGPWTVRVTNPDTRSGERANIFTVKACTCLPVVLKNR
jgi:hypothetical protein